jgi:predicted HTH transcriptional regulator
MDYDRFKRLIREGEKRHVDFKIECHAFAGNEAAKAELVKDIIAMCNNGYMKSYLLVGVSDDGKSFKSVANKKLTDDNLQHLCRNLINPPPKVVLYRIAWSKPLSKHSGIEFVIIEIGPHQRRAFCFARDMIDYNKRFCHRQNEVWIRQERTSALATPDEILRLVQGKPFHDDHDEATLVARSFFQSASESERKILIDNETTRVLQSHGYTLLPNVESERMRCFHTLLVDNALPMFYKRVNNAASIVSCVPYMQSFRGIKWHIKWHTHWGVGLFWTDLVDWSELPPLVTRLGRRKIKAVRRLRLMSVLEAVRPR